MYFLSKELQLVYWMKILNYNNDNFDFENGNKLEFQEYLTDLEENRENRPFLDKIYYQIAEYHRKNNIKNVPK